MTKIFCIGFQKTGTTSMEAALRQLGYRVCDVRFDLIPAVRQRDFDAIRQVVDQYDAFRDNPWPLLFKELDQQYPGSRFILTTRDESSWIRSVVNHFSHTPSAMLDLVYGYTFPAGHEEAFLRTYRQHNADVIQYFSERKKDLLVLDITQLTHWEPLCSFLGLPIPKVDFPHKNIGAYTWWGKRIKKFFKRVRSKIRSWRNPDPG